MHHRAAQQRRSRRQHAWRISHCSVPKPMTEFTSYLWMKLRVSSSCTVSRSSGQTAALWESSFCLVASSSTHNPKAKISTDRVYWFFGFVPAGSTSGCSRDNLVWHGHSATHAGDVSPACAATGVGPPLRTSWCSSCVKLPNGRSLHQHMATTSSDICNTCDSSADGGRITFWKAPWQEGCQAQIPNLDLAAVPVDVDLHM